MICYFNVFIVQPLKFAINYFTSTRTTCSTAENSQYSKIESIMTQLDLIRQHERTFKQLEL